VSVGTFLLTLVCMLTDITLFLDMTATIDNENIWHPFSSLKQKDNIKIKKGLGASLYTESGDEIIDAVSSWWVNIHGHARQELADVLYEQAQQLEHTIFAGFTHQPAIDITKGLLEVLPDFKRVFFSDNGSTAVEVGLKMALQYWHNLGTPKTKIISVEGGYHGDTFGSMSIAGKSSFFEPFNDLMFDVLQIPLPDNDQVIEQFKDLVKDKDVAIFVYEPLLQGAAGMRIYPKEILDELLGIAKAYDVICIADEVLTGFGRTGKNFCSDYMKNKPDIIALSKGITGGFMPLGVTLCNTKIESAYDNAEATKIFYHGHSYTANALSCAVAVKSLEILRSSQCQADIVRISEFHNGFMDRIKTHPQVKSVNTLGTVLSVEIKTEGESSYFNNIKEFIYKIGLKEGVLLRPLGNVMYLIPPYVITDEQLKKCYSVMKKVLDELKHIN